MSCVKRLLNICVVLLVVFAVAYADTGTESTTDEGLRCDAPSKKYSGYFCKGKNGGDKYCTICNVCGDKYQIADDGEECDLDNNNHPEGTCNFDCKLTYCGDNIKQTPNGRDSFDEECDNGAANLATGTCDVDCTLTFCGDQVIQNPNGYAINEQCDEGDQNSNNGICNDQCQITYCGDEILQRPNGKDNFIEECDKNDFSAGYPDKKICRDNCTVAFCGDEQVETIGTYKEECDSSVPANILAIDNTAICTEDSCELRYCGNTRVERDEQCDKGVGVNGNKANKNRYLKGNDIYYCNANCEEEELPKVCGDGIKSASVGEECDYGVNNGHEDRARKGDYYCTKQCKWKHAPKCVWISTWRNWTHEAWSAYSQVRNQVTHPKNVPSCFRNKIKALPHRGGYSSCDVSAGGGSALVVGYCGFKLSPGAMANLFGVGESVTSFWYFDENCKWVPRSKAKSSSYRTCGYAGGSWSPISLIWEKGANLHEGNTLVDFPLNPNDEGRYTVWKASAETPLLVYDPLNTGDVKDATQLFGSWTYGGQQAALTHLTSAQQDQNPKAWQNGYQALALLDADRNEKVDGQELADLYLWFDKNRDAKVDNDELRSVMSQGIKSLYFNNPEAISDREDVGLTIGYEREIDSHLITGQSVDWFGYSFDNKQLAIEAIRSQFAGSDVNDNAYAKPDLTAVDAAEYDQFIKTLENNRVQSNREDLSGFWVWEANDEVNSDRKFLPGLFALKEQADGRLVGYTLIEMPLAKNDAGYRGMVKAFSIEGEVKVDSTGKKKVSFNVADQETQSESISTVVIDLAGEKMQGRTEQKFVNNFVEGQDVESVTINYQWQATKIF